MNREAYEATLQVYFKTALILSVMTKYEKWPDYPRLDRLNERVYRYMQEMMEMTDYE